MVRFIDRDYELGLLEEAWKSKGAKFIVLYGRRRVGKTKLALEFAKGKSGVFFIAEDINKKLQLEELKNKVAEHFSDGFLRRAEIAEWRDLFDYLQKLLDKKEKLYLVIDEFSYMVKNDQALLSALQKFWDTFLSSTEVMLIVSGSIFGLMSDKVLSSASPLYGRRTKDILLQPLEFKDSAEFLKMPFEDKLKVYMSIGGVPEYLLKALNYRRAADFLNAEFFHKDGYFYREPYFLLSQEFKEIKTYFTILNAIASGNTRPTEIANFAGLDGREIYPYLENLMRLNFVAKQVPVLGRIKNGVYLIKDTLFDFWFNFVYKGREEIEKNTYRASDNGLNTYFGKRFEALVRDELLPMVLPKIGKTGRWWHKNNEIDILGLNEARKEILFVECKWQKNSDCRKILAELRQKAELVDWNKGNRKERYAIFAKSFKERLQEKDVILFDLADLEKAILKS